MFQSIYNNFKKIARFFGYQVVVHRIKSADFYEPVFPSATYAPWLSDASFKETYDTIKSYTLIDIHRLYELWQLVKETASLEGALIEVGVWRGGSAALIAKSALLEGITEPLYIADTFTGVAKAGENDTSYYKGGEHSDTSIEVVNEVIQKCSTSNIKILIGIFPEETAHLILEEKFRFCHIDVDVYQSAKDIVIWLWPKLVVGGIIVFDDYGFQTCDGITKFVNEERKKIGRVVIHNLNGHAIIIKTAE